VLASPAPGQSPQPGDVQRLVVITLSMQVGSTGTETRHVTYTPPPGWYVRSHQVECTRKTGNSSFSVATVPQDWRWVSTEKVEESYRTLIDMAARAGDRGLQAKFDLQRRQLLREVRHVRATHHALVVDATAKGEGFLRSGGGLELTVTAELVFVGTNTSLDRAVERHKASLPGQPNGHGPGRGAAGRQGVAADYEAFLPTPQIQPLSYFSTTWASE
jgi:hypothetical protein